LLRSHRVMDRLALAAVVLVGVPAVLIGYVTAVEGLLRLLPERRRAAVRPWLWLTPALAFLVVFLIYPTLNTVYVSFFDRDSASFVGLANYQYLFTDPNMLLALRNNALWLIFFTLLTVTFGLLIAVLTDRVPYESVAKAFIFLPMAISFVAAGVIWKFMYDFKPPGAPQTGTLNAALTTLVPGFEPQAWLVDRPWNNLALIVAAVWVWTGFCTVILSAGLKGIPGDVLEAARADGADEWQVFWRVIFPMLGSTIAVVATTMVITALKAFDVVYIMTNGNFGTEVIANRMYKELFNVRDFGRASAIAVILLAAIVPVMLLNLRRFREQEAIR
jgi:alpha-glucoside transport system permease protein